MASVLFLKLTPSGLKKGILDSPALFMIPVARACPGLQIVQVPVSKMVQRRSVDDN